MVPKLCVSDEVEVQSKFLVHKLQEVNAFKRISQFTLTNVCRKQLTLLARGKLKSLVGEFPLLQPL